MKLIDKDMRSAALGLLAGAVGAFAGDIYPDGLFDRSTKIMDATQFDTLVKETVDCDAGPPFKTLFVRWIASSG